MRYHPEPSFRHNQASHIGILYCNLGTPKTPDSTATRRYLAEFLSDPRVVEIPRPLWLALLYGIILPLRSGKSAAKYRSIWTDQGSPLLINTQAQANALQTWLEEKDIPCTVVCAMRYGEPSIVQGLNTLKTQGADRILVFCAYPQYSATTTASVWNAVGAWTERIRNVPELRFVKHYHDHPGYIAALAASVRQHWEQNGRAQHLLMSFHGIPERSLHLGDPYHCECYKSARLLAEALRLQEGTYSVAFQSRFGKTKWLQPYTEASLIALAQAGTQSLEVICPGFSSDCLETLEEIAIEGKATFLGHGGKTLTYIPCLNQNPDWITALGTIVCENMHDWLQKPAPDTNTLAQQHAAAMRLGAEG